MTAQRVLGILCLVAFLPSCTTWQTYSPGPTPLDDPIRITTHSGGKLVLESPTVEGGVMVGMSHGARFEIPLDSIAGYETQVSSAAHSAGLMLGIGALTALVASAIIASQMFD